MGAIWVGAAYADGGVHGDFNDPAGAGASTRSCAGCHRAHTAVGDGLIKATSSYALCTSCHSITGSSNVVDGIRNSNGAALKGGGFVNAKMNTTIAATGPTAPAPTTSAHKVNGMPGYTGDIAWGIGAPNSGAGTSVTLECTSCHDPHGGSGGIDATTGARIPTYRILRSNVAAQVTGAAGPVIVHEDTAATKTKFVDSLTSVYYGQSYANIDMTELNLWCATCHSRIHTDDASSPPGSTPSGDSIYNFRHSTVGTSVENNLGTTRLWPAGSPGCVTCHVSHGTTAVATTGNYAVPKPGGTDPLDSSLLRLDNRGVCEVCHNK